MNEQLPPHNEDAEFMLLACCCERPEIIPGISPDIFYATRRVFEAVRECKEEPNTVGIHIKLHKTLSPTEYSGLMKASDNLPTPDGWKYWLTMVQDCHRARQIVRIGERLQSAAEALSNGDRLPLQVVEEDLRKLGASHAIHEARSYKEVVPVVLEQFAEDWISDGSVRGFTTGLVDLDAVLGGLQRGRMYVIGARPGRGKSSLALGIADAAAAAGHPTHVISIEMTAEELVGRSIASHARVNPNSFRTHNPNLRASERDFKRMHVVTPKVAKLPVTIADRISSLQDIMMSIHQAITSGVQLIVVDYLQLIHVPGFRGNRNELVTEISNAMKRVAHQHQIPVIVVSQLNRSSEREGRRPGLADLREGGSIEQDADCVILLHQEDDDQLIQNIEAVVAKNRGGRTGPLRLTFYKEYTRFECASKIDPDYSCPHNDA